MPETYIYTLHATITPSNCFLNNCSSNHTVRIDYYFVKKLSPGA